MQDPLLYFVPGPRQTMDRATLRELGLGHLCDGRIQARRNESGPGGQAGLVFWAPRETPERPLGYWNDGRQEWRCCNEGAFWLGWYKDDPPTPEKLAKARMVPGETVVLGDDGAWLFPDVDHVPQGYGFDAHGQPCLTPLPKYDAFREARETLWRLFFTDGELPVREWIQKLGLCLSVNYRIGEAEIWALGLMSEENIVPAVEAALTMKKWQPEIDKILESEKKTKSPLEASSGGSGAPGETGG